MIAVDSNVLVRALTKDDPGQAKQAAKILATDDIFIPKTVFLEMAWVLRYAYDIDRRAIMTGFRKLMGLPNVKVEDQQNVYQAISWYEGGLDFADALHLASSMHADRFVTFDKAFIKAARKRSPVDISTP
ncbi:MAG: type II toxin-antitoxin system VapC family toxin [Pseudomonadota bacterium]